MKKPNLFVIGAPKCGTTSVYKWLNSHNNIYMSPIKEPCYFNTDNFNRNVRSIDDYEKLFEGANKKHKVIGEASVWYLQSKCAVENIKKYNPKSKFIICIRDPVKMAISLHEQQLYSGNEYIENFEEAWRAQVDRKGGKKVSFWTRDKKHLMYGDICSLGSQIQRVISKIDIDKIHILLLRDIKENPKKEYKKMINFVGLNYKRKENFEVKNKGGKKRKSRVLRLLSRSIHNIKNKIGLYKGIGLGKLIYNMNTKRVKREKLSSNIEEKMRCYFSDEVVKMEKIMGRELNFWK